MNRKILATKMSKLAGNFSRPRSLTSVECARPTCYSCMRPATYCVCNLVKPFTAHCNLLILQHPHERRKYHSTTRLVLRAIENSRRLSGIIFSEGKIQEALGGQLPYLLYPCADAVSCEEPSLDSDSTVIVVDGTWDEAQKIVFRNPFLRTFPKLSFKTSLRSNYRIRKQPKDYCLSTLESIAYMLKMNALAQNKIKIIPAYDSLLHGFDQMVERQLPFLGISNPHSPKANSGKNAGNYSADSEFRVNGTLG